MPGWNLPLHPDMSQLQSQKTGILEHFSICASIFWMHSYHTFGILHTTSLWNDIAADKTIVCNPLQLLRLHQKIGEVGECLINSQHNLTALAWSFVLCPSFGGRYQEFSMNAGCLTPAPQPQLHTSWFVTCANWIPTLVSILRLLWYASSCQILIA